MPINFAIKLAATVAMEAVQIGLQASRRTYGPRLSETQVTTADYGTLLPRFLGARRLTGQIIWSKDLEIVEHTTKIKGGGKQTNESALWTAGIALADFRGGVGPLDKILKIWLDETLAYDATGAGPVSYASSLGFDLASVMRVCTGAEDQMPDPAYVDYCDGRYGPDSAPAFRGLAMLVFDRMPLDNFGNRPPQISVLAVSSAVPTYPFETRTTGLTLENAVFSPDGTRMLLHSFADFEIWDIPSRARLVSGAFPASVNDGQPAIDDDGTIWAVTGGWVSSQLSHFTVDGFGSFETDVPTGIAGSTGVRLVGYTADDGTAQNILFITTLTGGSVSYLSGGAFVTTALPFTVHTYFPDGENVWVAGNSGSTIGFYCVAGPRAGTTHTMASPAGSSSAMSACNPGAGQFVCNQANKWFTIDDTSWAASSAVTIATSSPAGPFERVRPGDTSVWVAWQEISFTGPTSLRTLNQSLWTAGSVNRPTFARAIDAIIADDAGDPLVFRFLDRATNGGVLLRDIVDTMCTDANLSGRVTTSLTQVVAGFSWTRGDVKSQMQPLLDIHDVDARPHDFDIEFRARGTAPSGATLMTRDFAKSGDNPRYKHTTKQDTDLPKILRVNFADTGFDQETNNILSPLPTDAVDSQRDVVIDISTFADTPDGAQQKGDRFMRREWNSRQGLENSLTAQELALEPGDMKTVDLDGIAENFVLTGQTIVGTRIDCTFVRDEVDFAAVNSSTVGPPMDGRDPEVIVIPAPIKGFVVDGPLRRDSDADARPLLYSGAGSYAALPFPGAALFEASGVGDARAYDQLFATIGSGATWGLCTTALGTVPSPWLWDRGNTLTVALQSGSLTSVAEADVDADPSLNLILVGRDGNWEYLNFTTATLNGDGSYTLSGFKRGRRGTEWACAGHEAGEAWIFASSLEVDVTGLDEVGADLSFKAQAIGRSLDAAPPIAVAPFTGATLKPYAPARIEWSTDGTDLFGTITRRTRVGGAWVGGSPIPLSENSEAYEVDVYNGATFKRTISASGTNLFTYTGAQIAADGNTVGSPPPVNVYQMSDAVGRGYALAA